MRGLPCRSESRAHSADGMRIVPEVVVALPPVQRRHVGPRRERGRIRQVEDREAVRRVERQPERLQRQPRGVDVLQALAIGVPDLVEVPALLAQARPAEEGGPDQAQEVRRLRLQPAPASLLAQPGQVRHAAVRHEPVHHIDLRRIETDEDDGRGVAHRRLPSGYDSPRRGGAPECRDGPKMLSERNAEA